MKQRYDTYIWGAFFILIVFVAVAGFVVPSLRENGTTPPTGENNSTTTYINQSYGVTFLYPNHYTLVPNQNAEGEHLLSTVSFIETVEYQAFLASTDAREGPPAITFEIYENPDNMSVSEWLTASNYFGIPEHGVPTLVTIADIEAVRFPWDGLYPGETVALLHNSYIYAWSYSALDMQVTRPLFDVLLQSIQFTP